MQDLKQTRGPHISQKKKYRQPQNFRLQKVTRGKFHTEYQQILGATVQNYLPGGPGVQDLYIPVMKPFYIYYTCRVDPRKLCLQNQDSVFPRSNFRMIQGIFTKLGTKSYDIRGHVDAVHFSFLQSVTA